MICKKRNGKIVDYLSLQKLDKLLNHLSLEEIERLLHYLYMLELANKLIPISIIGYILTIVFMVIKYIITNDIVLAIKSFIIPELFAYIVLLISFNLDKYSMNKIKAIMDIGKIKCLREMINKKIK